jgi:hypothetical protein
LKKRFYYHLQEMICLLHHILFTICDFFSGTSCVLVTEPLNFPSIKGMGPLSRSGIAMSEKARKETRNNEMVICVNPGGEQVWDKIASAHVSPSGTFVVLNNAYSTSYDIGNQRGYEEAYYLKRISKGWVFRQYPGPWEAYLEKPDGTVELLKSYKTKPLLRDVSALVRDEVRLFPESQLLSVHLPYQYESPFLFLKSFKRYAIGNDRWMGGRL